MKPAVIAAILLASFAAAASAAASASPGPDACSLLTGKEVESVQKEKVASAKASEPPRDRFAVSQCFYTLPTFSKSVSVEVTRRLPGAGAADSPREQWKQMFARAMNRASEKEDEEEREAGKASEQAKEKAREARKPRPIAGLGDQAYWVGSSLGGGLYVLKDDAFVRLSVGGPDPENVKVEKLTKLARPLLRRL